MSVHHVVLFIRVIGNLVAVLKVLVTIVVEVLWLTRISRKTEPCLSSETQDAKPERDTVIGHVNEQSVSQFGVTSCATNLDNHYDMVLVGIQSATISFCPTDHVESATFFAVLNKISTLQVYIQFFMYQDHYVLLSRRHVGLCSTTYLYRSCSSNSPCGGRQNRS